MLPVRFVTETLKVKGEHTIHLKGVRLVLFPLYRCVLKHFATDGRDLTDKETKAFLQAADKDGDGKIGAEGKIKQYTRTAGASHIYSFIYFLRGHQWEP